MTLQQDSLALIFLIEVNNYLHIATHSDASDRWTVNVPSEEALAISRVKTRFILSSSVLMICVQFGLSFAWTVDKRSHSSSSSSSSSMEACVSFLPWPCHHNCLLMVLNLHKQTRAYFTAPGRTCTIPGTEVSS